MRSDAALAVNDASGVTRRVVRLLVLLGAGLAAYLGLCLFDHGARADAGSTDQPLDQVAVIKAKAADIEKAIPTPKSIKSKPIKSKPAASKTVASKSIRSKASTSKVSTPTSRRATIKPAEVRSPKIQAPGKAQVRKVQAPVEAQARKVQAPVEAQAREVQAPVKSRAREIQKPLRSQARKIRVSVETPVRSVPVGEAVRQLRDRTSEVRRTTAGVVQGGAPATVTSALAVVVRPEVPAPFRLSTRVGLTELPALPRLTDLPRVDIPAMTQLGELPRWELPPWPQLPDLPRAEMPPWPQLPDLPRAEMPSWSQLPGVSPVELPSWAPLSGLTPVQLTSEAQLTPASAALSRARTAESSAFMPYQPPFDYLPSRSANELFGVDTEQGRSGSAPGPSRQPGDRSNSTGQARDSGGGNAPTLGTVSSFWRVEVAAFGRRLASDIVTRGRTVRYAGPPS